MDIAAGLTIVIPAFNEGRRLPLTLDRLLDELPSTLEGPWELIVSDDGSSDGTASLVSDRGEDSRLRIISNQENRGKGAALVAGAREARYSYVLFLDADLPVPISSIPAMVDRAASLDLLCGSRRLRGATFDPPQPLSRRVRGRLFRLAVASIGFRVSSDPQCGVKVLRGDTVLPLLDELVCTRFGFDIELIVRSERAGIRVGEMPVAWSHVPGSSLRPIRDAITTLRELWSLRARLRLDRLP